MYLDPPGLAALWREALLAQKVLEGLTRGYKQHPQLFRFRRSGQALPAIGNYLFHVWQESQRRGYNFSPEKIHARDEQVYFMLNKGQLEYEFGHLLHKLERRSPQRYQALAGVKDIKPHPLFILRQGGIEDWEKYI